MQFREISSLDDELLMVRVRDQDCLDSFAELFDRWNERILRLGFRLTGDWQDAEDTTQEVFGKIYWNRKRYQANARFGTYLWRIAINHARDVIRKRVRNRSKQEEFREQSRQAGGVGTGSTEVQDHVQQALLNLPESLREVLVLRHYEGLQFRQIAELLSIPEGTVASRMAKALRVLKQKLDTSKVLLDQRQKPKSVG